MHPTSHITDKQPEGTFALEQADGPSTTPSGQAPLGGDGDRLRFAPATNSLLSRGGGMSGHQSASSQKYEYLSPPAIVRALGTFDLDPCAPVLRPWDTARNHFTVQDDGLGREWF